MMKSRFNLLLVCFIFGVHSVLATAQENMLQPGDRLKLISISKANESAFYIDGIIKLPGDFFYASESIDWSSVKSILVKNMSTRDFINISPGSNSSHSNSFYSEYIKKNITATKGANDKVDIETTKKWLSQIFYFVNTDELFIRTSLIIDDKHTYRFIPKGQSYASGFNLMYNPDEPFLMYIPKQALIENNIDIDSKPCTFEVRYIDDGKNIFITDNLVISNY